MKLDPGEPFGPVGGTSPRPIPVNPEPVPIFLPYPADRWDPPAKAIFFLVLTTLTTVSSAQ
jgi:hypothetical protein